MKATTYNLQCWLREAAPFVAVLFLAAASLGRPVAAQQEHEQNIQVFEEVLVVAQKRSQNLQIVPVAVSAFSAKDLETSGVEDILDLAAIAPALYVRTRSDPKSTPFIIRGIGTYANNFGLESSVGLYVDGVYRSRQGSMLNNLVDIHGVEVLRGPQGTLFGRNTLAGAVVVNTAPPSHEGFDSFVDVTAGNYDLLNVSGAASFSAIDDVLAFRITGFSSQRDGYVDDVELGDEEIFNRDRWGARLQALYTPNSELSVRLIADYSEVDEICCALLVVQDNLRPVALPEGATPYAGTDEVERALGATVFPSGHIHDLETALNRLPQFETEDSGLTLLVDWELEDFTLHSITGYRSYEMRDDFDVDFIDLDQLSRMNTAEQSSWSQELRISSEGSRLSYVAGLYYFNQDLDNLSTTVLGTDINGMFSHGYVWFPDSNNHFPLEAIPLLPYPEVKLFPPDSGAVNSMQQDHQAWAVFGQADYYLTDSWMLTAGLRYTREEKELEGVFTEGTAPDFNDGVVAIDAVLEQFAAIAPHDPVDESLDDDQVTGTLKLTWFIDDRSMLYVSYGTGYKSGGTNTNRINSELEYIFEPETSQALEIGFKAEFPAQALRLNVALHRTDVDDLQVDSVTDGGTVLQNAARVETYGGEIELTWLPTDTLTISAAYANTQGEFKDYENGLCGKSTLFHSGRPDPGDPSGGEDPLFCDRSGEDLHQNPDTFLLTANQLFEVTGGIGGSLLLEYSHVGEVESALHDPYLTAPSYDLLNLRLGFRFEQYDLSATLWGRNVLDEEYQSSGFEPLGTNGKVLAMPGEPRTYGISVRKDF